MTTTIPAVNRLDELALTVDFLEQAVPVPPKEIEQSLGVLVQKHEASKSNDWILTPRKVCVIKAMLEMHLAPEKKSLTSRALGRILQLLALPRHSWEQFIVDVPNAEVMATDIGRELVAQRLDRVKWKN